MAEIGERMARAEQQIEDVKGDVSDIRREIFGPPRDDSVKGRLHVLENDRVAASAAEAALTVAKELRDDRSHRAWSTREKVAALVLSAILATSPYAMFFLARGK